MSKKLEDKEGLYVYSSGEQSGNKVEKYFFSLYTQLNKQQGKNGQCMEYKDFLLEPVCCQL